MLLLLVAELALMRQNYMHLPTYLCMHNSSMDVNIRMNLGKPILDVTTFLVKK